MKTHPFRMLTAYLTIVLIMISLLAIPAAAVSVPQEPALVPDYVDIETLWAILNIGSSNEATCSSFVRSATFTNTVYLTMKLQQLSGKNWSDIKTWSASGTGSISLTRRYYVTSGYSYRLKVTATVYTSAGKFVEQSTAYSNVV